jgi:hypothetical protein
MIAFISSAYFIPTFQVPFPRNVEVASRYEREPVIGFKSEELTSPSHRKVSPVDFGREHRAIATTEKAGSPFSLKLRVAEEVPHR